jgi:uncharacterized peroxidase-related enzyme
VFIGVHQWPLFFGLKPTVEVPTMPHIQPLPRASLAQFEQFFQMAETMMGGFVPNSLFTMGHRPEILQAFMMLAGTINGPGTVDVGLKQLVAYVASNAAGCRYCQAHTSANAAHEGVQVEKIEHAFEFETYPGFSDAERAALRLARDASLVPNLVEAEHFEALRRHFDEPQIVELVAVCALFGFLNRWNDTMSTELEGIPRTFADKHLASARWEVGKHGG